MITPRGADQQSQEKPNRRLNGFHFVQDAARVATWRQVRSLQADHFPIHQFQVVMVERYPDRSLMSRSEILAGRMHGVSEGWFTNGALQVREHFEQGISHGLRIRWNEHGTKVAEARIVSGKIEGMFRRWHDNGVLAEELAMVHGEPEGVSRAWYPSGHLKAVVQMSGGAQVSRMDYADGEVPRIASR